MSPGLLAGALAPPDHGDDGPPTQLRAGPLVLFATGDSDSITIDIVGNGSVAVYDDSVLQCSGLSSGSSCPVTEGDSISLVGTPTDSSDAVNWSVCGVNSPGTIGMTNTKNDTCTFTAGGSETDSVTFTPTYQITTMASPGAGGSVAVTDDGGYCNGASSCTAGQGDDVTFTETTVSGYAFTGWSVASCTGKSPTCTISDYPGTPTTVTADFVPTYQITTSASPGAGGSIAVTDTGGYCDGASSCTAGRGDDVTFTETTVSGYAFTGWSVASCTGTSPTCTIDNYPGTPTTVTANYVALYQITTAVQPAAADGSVAINDLDGECTGGVSCTAKAGDQVTFSATASSGYDFVSWSGVTCSSTSVTQTTSTCVISSLSATEAVTATFVRTYLIAAGIDPTGNGYATVTDANAADDCTDAAFCLARQGDEVTLTPSEYNSKAYRFVTWNGPQGSICGSTADNPCVIASVQGPETDIPTFALNQYEVVGATTGTGTVATSITAGSTTNTMCGPSGAPTSCLANYGDTVTLTATPGPGQHVATWTGPSCATVTGNTCVVSNVAAAETDTVNFMPDTYTINVETNGNGVVTLLDNAATCNSTTSDTPGSEVSCSVTYGDQVQITATGDSPNNNTGFHFEQWSGVTPTCTGTDHLCTFTASQNETDIATFIPPAEFTISASAGPGGSVALADTNDTLPVCPTGSTNCVVDYLDDVTITATPLAGFTVASWSGGGCTGTTDTCTIDNIAADASVAVTFALPVPGTGSTAVYVSPNGSDANAGTESKPVATLQRGLAIAENDPGAFNQLRVAQGSYSGPLDLTARDDGIGIYGGFNPSSWVATYNPATPTTISGAPEAVLANGASDVTLQQLDVDGQGSNAPSSSSYGIVALGGATLTLNNVAVRAANGTAGSSGSSGSAGTDGSAGGTGGSGQTAAAVVAACLASSTHCSPVDPAGGSAGVGANGNDYSLRHAAAYEQNPLMLAAADTLGLPGSGPSAGDGGFGGFGSTGAPTTSQGCVGTGAAQECGPTKIVSGKTEVLGPYVGAVGSSTYDANVIGGGAGGSAGASSSTTDGHSGANGSAGTNGAHGANGAAGSSGSPAGPAWTPGNGGAGANGAPGSGGGGGGGGGGDMQLGPNGPIYGSGNAGGGGGGGGTGGTAGAGGGGGGGSFGLYLDGDSTVTALLGSTITAGNGGAGGNGGSGGDGGAGGSGGAGGAAGVPRIGAGGNGGQGGSGGGGGAGGGGAGGPSYAFYVADTGVSTVSMNDATFANGTGGIGGLSGDSGSSRLQAPPGPSGACSGACPSLPIVLPALGLLSGHQITATLKCRAVCHGTATVRLMRTGSAKSGTLLAQLAFRLNGGVLSAVHLTLKPGGVGALAAVQRLAVQLTTVVAAGGKSNTFVSVLELTRKLPPQATAVAAHPSAARNG
ncbi:MAG: hypothetical protein ABSD82_03595 [Solirubrobacteraceae bacterium]